MLYEHRRADVAVFIDFENVYVSVRDKLDANPNFEAIMDRCNDLGRVVIARAYADWYRYPRITSALYANSIEPMYVPTYYYDKDMGRTGRAIKNSVDMNLCIDVMKTLYTHSNIGKFVLATGDRDFIPLVNSIRQQGKEVIIIGIGGAASTHLAQSADEFVFYEQLIGKPTPATQRKGKRHDQPEAAPSEVEAAPVEAQQETDIYTVLVDAVHLVRERGYVSTLGSLKLVMKELMGGDFKESRYRDVNGKPFSKFKDFVIDAERRGKVQIFTSGTVNEVFLPGEDPLKLSQFADAMKEEPVTDSVDQHSLNNGHQKHTDNGKDTPDEQLASTSSGRSRRRRRPRRSSRKEETQDQPQVEQAGVEEPTSDELSTARFEEEVTDQVQETSPSDETPSIEPGEETAAFEELAEANVLENAESPEPLDHTELIEQFAAEDDTEPPGEPVPDTDVADMATSMLPNGDEEQYEHMLAGLLAEDGEPDNDERFDQALADATQQTQLSLDDQFDEVAEQTPPAEPDQIDTLFDFVNDEQPELMAPAATAEEPGDSSDESAVPETIFELTVDEDGQSPEPQFDQPDQFHHAETEPQAETEPRAEGETHSEEGLNGTVQTFSEHEWEIFRQMMAEYTQPISFSQILENLKKLRNEKQITRTNEQLRTMTKQAISNGLLERSGRGARIYYHLKLDQDQAERDTNNADQD